MNIQLTDIVKSFGMLRANDGISLSVAAGTIHGLLGENGAGKTTLMKVLSGYQPCDSGTIRVDDREVSFDSPEEAIAAGIGMLHQDPMDVPALSVLDNFALGHDRRLVLSRHRSQSDLARLCRRFGFELDPDALVGSLTVGERQQLEMVRLLALGVRTIILDEPTTGISAPQKVLLFETLRGLAAEGLSLIFVSHKLDDVEQLCSRATVLRDGRVAGEVLAPFDTDELVSLMFGQCLSEVGRSDIAPGEPMLEVADVSVRTHRLEITNINLAVRAGEVVGLAGLEGSGQGILMQTCAGLLRAHKGRIRLGGQDMSRSSYHQYLQAGVAHVPAARLEEGMVGGLTIREHVALAHQPTGLMVRWSEAEGNARERIDTYRVVGRPETPVASLSGGNQQRLLLALLPEHLKLLILEHPTRGLDIESTRWVWNRLHARRRHGTGLLYTSTDLDELVAHSDRIVVFSGGRMSAPVPAEDITCEELGYLIGGKGYDA